jgi:hypothetical protein
MLARVRQHRVSRVWIVLDRQWRHDDAHTSVAPRQLTHACTHICITNPHESLFRGSSNSIMQVDALCSISSAGSASSSSPALLSASTQCHICHLKLPKSACSCPLVTYTTDRLIDHGPHKHMHLHALFWHGRCAYVEQLARPTSLWH